MLIGQFWGTSDAAGIPAPLCKCPVCQEAREKGGRSVRLRSNFRLSDAVMLDFGADTVIQSMKYGDLTDVHHFLITHTHEDHFNPHLLLHIIWTKGYYEFPMHIYLTGKAYEMADHLREAPWMLKGMLNKWENEGRVIFHRLEYGVRVKIDEFYVTPFRGRHRGNVGEDPGLYLIELPDGRKLFYGLDSGVYYPETLEALKAHTIDIFITEATAGTTEVSHPGHMWLGNVEELIRTLYAQGTLTEESVVYLTHINHLTSHDQMLEAVEKMQLPVPTVVAYDGLKVFDQP